MTLLYSLFQSLGGDSDDEDDLCEYEKQRLRKIKENRAFLASLNLVAAKEDLKAVTKNQVRVSVTLNVLVHVHHVCAV